MRTSPFVKVMRILSALWPLGGGAVNVLLSVYSFEIFHAGNQGVGILYGSLGLGFILGGGLTPYISRWIIPAAAVGFVVEGVAHIFVSQSPNLALAALFLHHPYNFQPLRSAASQVHPKCIWKNVLSISQVQLYRKHNRHTTIILVSPKTQ